MDSDGISIGEETVPSTVGFSLIERGFLERSKITNCRAKGMKCLIGFDLSL